MPEIKETKVKRNSAIELLRIIAMVMIVAHHFAVHGGFEFDTNVITLPRLWWGFIGIGGNFGVDVFMLISGYFLVSSKAVSVDFRKTFRFWTQVLFYSVVLFVISISLGWEQVTFNGIKKAIMPVTFNMWWFASVYFILFLLHPYINIFLKSMTAKEYRGVMGALLLLWSVIPTVANDPFFSNILIEMFMVYVIGGYIKLHGLSEKIKSKHYFGLFFISLLAIYLSYVAIILVGIKVPSVAESNMYFYGRVKVPMLFCAVSIFMAFITMKPFNSKFINTVATGTFGVYLIHDSHALRSLIWKTVFKTAEYGDTIMIIPYSILVTVLIFVVCCLIDIIRAKTVEVLAMKFYDGVIDKAIKKCLALLGKGKTLVFGEDN